MDAPSPEASVNKSGVFPAALLGKAIECVSMDDAVAIKTADGVLCGKENRDITPFELSQIADVLKRYECHDAAVGLLYAAPRRNPKL